MNVLYSSNRLFLFIYKLVYRHILLRQQHLQHLPTTPTTISGPGFPLLLEYVSLYVPCAAQCVCCVSTIKKMVRYFLFVFKIKFNIEIYRENVRIASFQELHCYDLWDYSASII